MKKIFLVLLVGLITVSLSGQSIFKRGIKVGNSVTTATVDSISKTGSIVKFYEGATRLTESDVINDSIDARLAAAIDIDAYLADFQGGGSGITMYELKFRVDSTSGAPTAGDSTLTHTSFIGQHLAVFRGGHRQYVNDTSYYVANSVEFNSTTGTVTFHPVFTTGEQVVIEIGEPVNWESLALEGAESALLTNLLGYYGLNETTGTTVNDSHTGGYDGVTTGTVNATGIIGKAEQLDGTDAVNITHAAGLVPTGDVMSISMWFKLTSLPSTVGHNFTLARFRDTTTPYYSAFLFLHTTGYIGFYLTNSTYTEFETEATATLNIDQWYHVVAVCEGNGLDSKIYLDGVDITSTHPAFSGQLLEYDGNVSLGNHYDGGDYATVGYIDEVAIYSRALTGAEVLELRNLGVGKAYPF